MLKIELPLNRRPDHLFGAFEDGGLDRDTLGRATKPRLTSADLQRR
jgi:hypothetical protein